jgi:hypothetical protein
LKAIKVVEKVLKAFLKAKRFTKWRIITRTTLDRKMATVGQLFTEVTHLSSVLNLWLYLYKQVGNLSSYALHFPRFKRKRHGASKYSNLIFERFICVFASLFFPTKKLLIHCIVGKARKVWERSQAKNIYKIAIFA